MTPGGPRAAAAAFCLAAFWAAWLPAASGQACASADIVGEHLDTSDCGSGNVTGACQVGCELGYLGGTVTFECVNGTFEGVAPACAPVECDPGSILGAGLLTGDCINTTFMDTCSVTCGPGFYGDAATLTCSANTTFDGALPQCWPTCSLLGLNGTNLTTSDCLNITFDVEGCQVECDRGYRPDFDFFPCEEIGAFVGETVDPEPCPIVVTAQTSTRHSAGTTSDVLASFLVNDAWTQPRALLTSVNAGGIAQASFPVVAEPTMMALIATSTDGWLYTRLDVASVEAANPGPCLLYDAEGGEGLWMDIDGVAEQTRQYTLSPCGRLCRADWTRTPPRLRQAERRLAGSENATTTTLTATATSSTLTTTSTTTFDLQCSPVGCAAGSGIAGNGSGLLTAQCNNEDHPGRCRATCKGVTPGMSLRIPCSAMDVGAFGLPAIPRCVRMPCDPAITITDPSVDASGCAGTRYEDMCTARCAPGWFGEPSTLQCALGGGFTGPYPTCTRVSCAADQSRWGLGVGMTAEDCLDKRFQGTCEIRCTDGYFGTPSTLTCMADGTFRGADPICTDMHTPSWSTLTPGRSGNEVVAFAFMVVMASLGGCCGCLGCGCFAKWLWRWRKRRQARAQEELEKRKLPKYDKAEYLVVARRHDVSLGFSPVETGPNTFVVDGISAGTWAERNGLEVGDELVEIDGKPPGMSHEKLTKYLQKARPLTLTLARLTEPAHRALENSRAEEDTRV